VGSSPIIRPILEAQNGFSRVIFDTLYYVKNLFDYFEITDLPKYEFKMISVLIGAKKSKR
jgi:hypothetical protein